MKKKIFVIVLLILTEIFFIGFGVGTNVNKTKLEVPRYDRLEYLEDYAINKTNFGDEDAWFIIGEKMFYYTIDRIFMTEKEYVTLYWLDLLKTYNESLIFVDNYGFNTSDIEIEWEHKAYEQEYPYQFNNTWFIPIPDFKIKYIPEYSLGYAHCWNGTSRAWELVEQEPPEPTKFYLTSKDKLYPYTDEGLQKALDDIRDGSGYITEVVLEDV